MFIRFFVTNFMSFSEETEFSLIAGQSRQLDDHLEKIENHDFEVLKASAIYGANGSGKSNLIKAMKFGKELIVRGSRPDRALKVTPFKLNQKGINSPSKFEYHFSILNKVYSYGIEVNHKYILSEWLYEITSSGSEKKIFTRKTSEEGDVNIEFGKLGVTKDEEQFLSFVAKGTRGNQPFLTEANDRNVKEFKFIYNWFKDNLIFIFPNTINDGLYFALSPKSSNSVVETFAKFLNLFDTGISSVKQVAVNFDAELPTFPKSIKEEITSKLKTEKDRIFIQGANDRCYSISKDFSTGELIAQKIMTAHKLNDANGEVDFEVNEESDGTQRIMDFIPAITRLLEGNVSVFIDEIDRSLHPELTRAFFKIFYNMRTKGSQLIVTTHESSLLDQELLRRDEIWFVEKTPQGNSKIYSLEEYKPRHDKDIRKGYLLGRYGAIPFFGNLDSKLIELHTND